MKNRFGLFLLLLSSLLLVSCTSSITKKRIAITEALDSWKGHHQSELIALWGPPTKTYPDGKGGIILIYEYYRDLGQTPGRAYTDAWGNVKYTYPKNRGYTANRMFYINENGVIYSYRWQGI